MARLFSFRSPDEVPDDGVVGVDREDFDHVMGAERNPFAKFVLKGQMPGVDPGAGDDWPAGSIGSAIAQLSDVALDEVYPITSFTVTPAEAERGEVLSDMVLDWAIGAEPSRILAQTLTGPGTPPPLVFDDRTATIPGPLSVDATWTLTVQGGMGAVQAVVVLRWLDKVFWGRGGGTALTEAQVEALASNRLEDDLTDYDFAAGAGYWWIAAPDAHGILQVVDSRNGLEVPFDDMGTLTITNPHGQGVSYRRWRSTYPQVAAGTVVQV